MSEPVTDLAELTEEEIEDHEYQRINVCTEDSDEEEINRFSNSEWD